MWNFQSVLDGGSVTLEEGGALSGEDRPSRTVIGPAGAAGAGIGAMRGAFLRPSWAQEQSCCGR